MRINNVSNIARIQKLNEGSTAAWGKMSVYQMLKHNRLWDEMVYGNTHYKRAFLGRLFGRIALRAVLKDDTALGKNSPTIPALKIKEACGNVEAEKEKWIAMIKGYGHFSNETLDHPFFGKMNKEQIGYMVYKHADHHLRQFGV